MASATSTASSTKETTNYARLCRLLVDFGTQALRDTFDAIHASTNLHAVLAANKSTLQSLRARKIINPIQWGKLFPTIPTSVSSCDFDTTLLVVLLRNLCGLTPPPTGWDALPAATDLSREADIARVKYFRNTVYGHAENASVDDVKFNDYWRGIRDTLVRLGGVTYKATIGHLRNECMDPEVENHYRELLSQWKKDEDNIKEELCEIRKILSVLTTSQEVVNQDESSNPNTGPMASHATYTYHENQELESYCIRCKVCLCHICGQIRHDHHTNIGIQQAAEERKVPMAKTVGRHDIGIEINGWPLTGCPRRVDVKPHRYKVVRSCGSRGKRDGEFDGTWSIAKNEDTGNIAVADYGNRRIQLFSGNLEYLKTMGDVTGSQTGADLKIAHPTSVAYLTNSDLIVTHEDLHLRRLSVITDRGEFIEHAKFSKHIITPHHVFVNADGDGHVVVCDEGDKKIKVFSSDGKKLLQSFGAPNCDVLPSFACSHNDMFFVSYIRAHCVKVFSTEGSFLYDIGSKGSGVEQLRYPEGLAVDAFDNLIVCDANDIDHGPKNGALKMFTLDGQFLTSFCDEDVIKVPWIVKVCKNGDLLVTDLVKDCFHILQ